MIDTDKARVQVIRTIRRDGNTMGQNRAQKAAAARAKQEAAEATQTPATPTPVTAEQPKPAAPVAAPAKPATQTESKQQLSFMRLVVALREQRQIEVKPEQLKQDGKFILVQLGDAWPTIRIGANGGFVLPAIRSYKEGLDTMVKADELLTRQNARDAKKAQATAPAAPKPEAVAV
jgi:hypothetical protein